MMNDFKKRDNIIKLAREILITKDILDENNLSTKDMDEVVSSLLDAAQHFPHQEIEKNIKPNHEEHFEECIPAAMRKRFMECAGLNNVITSSTKEHYSLAGQGIPSRILNSLVDKDLFYEVISEQNKGVV